MASLFRNRFARPAAPRRRRVRAAAPAMPLERLEPRLALAGDTFSRPMLERAATLVMDASIGPNPVVMSKSQVVGNDVKSFVISHVPEGSIVEKWDAATEKWIDVSTKPISSNPQELMRLLGRRVIHQGDKIQWRPKAGFEGAAQQAFQMINWDDGSELLAVSAEAPSAVQNLEVSPTGVGELTVTWEAPATGDATSYTVTLTTNGRGSSFSSVHSTTNTSYKVSGLSSADAYSFAVTASNEEGTSLASTATFAQPAISVGMRPQGLTTGLDGSIWVANQGDSTVQQITNSGGVWTAQAAISVGKNPYGLTNGLDGSIWVANYGSNTVQQITNIGGVWTAQPAIEVGKHPSGLTTGLDGSIWVANFYSKSVQQITSIAGVWTAQPAITVGTSPCALTTGLDGSIWVASNAINTVWQITNIGGVWTAQPAITVSLDSSALTTGLDGSIWVANTSRLNNGSNSVQQITNIGGVWTAQPVITIGSESNALTTGLDGSIWATVVQQITNIGGVWTPQPAIAVGEYPRALTTGLDGSIWVANYQSNTVQQILAPPNAPDNLAAVFGPGSGEMTLAWQPPVIDGGTDVISYTATVSQGTYAKTITTNDTFCVFDKLTLGSGPTYFTVTATNFAGESTTAALQIDAYGNPVPSQPNTGVGITTNGAVTSGGGFDGSGNTYSWTAIGDTSSGGALVGNTLISGGLAFHVNPNQPDFTWAAGQDIEATGTGNVLTLAAAAVNGSQASQQLTLNFTDDTTATWTQSFSDWCSPQNYANESILSTQSYRNTASGGTNDTTNYIYSYGYTLPAGKALKSITLPNNSQVRILGAVLSDPMAVDLSNSWNEYGLVSASDGNVSLGKTSNGYTGFDNDGNYYDAHSTSSQLGIELRQTGNYYNQQITWGGGTFNLGPVPNSSASKSTAASNNNFVRAEGQTIDLTSGSFSKLLMIGAAVNGNQTDQALTLTFTDGSTSTWTQSFTDWRNNSSSGPLPSGTTLAASNESLVGATWVIDRHGVNTSENAYVYGYSYDIPVGKTLKSITLPNNSDVGILGMALV